ncbi:MAG: AraC family transcriptional regulator [Spirochaetales bacterium]|nr:AraC family transcriptional regulator [Spirochaetales bacterium]
MNVPHKQDGFDNEKLIIVPKDFFSTCRDHPLVKPLFVTDAGFFPSALHHFRERNHGIDENILIYCIKGKGTIRIPGELIKMEGGEIFCIPAGTGHLYSAEREDPWSILWVHFRGDNCPLYPIAEKRVITLTSSHENNALQYLFTMLLDILEHNYTIGNYIYASQVMSLILSDIYLKERTADMDQQNHKLTKIIRYMLTQLNRDMTLEQLAGEMHLSKSYINIIFKKYTSRSPMDYFIHLKIQQACKDLKITNMLISEVSRNLGYRDPCYFSRLFKRIVGMTPREYQKQNQAVMIPKDIITE